MKQILVIKPSSLGDIIHALAVVEALRRERPQLQVDWVARDIFAPFVEACHTVRHTHVFFRKAGLVPFGQLVTQIRETGYDAVVDMQGLARSGLLALLSGVPRRNRYGRSDARELSFLAYGKTAEPPLVVGGSHVMDARGGFRLRTDTGDGLAVHAGGSAVTDTGGDLTVHAGDSDVMGTDGGDGLAVHAGGSAVTDAGGGLAVHAVDILRGFLPLFGVDAGVPLGRLEFGDIKPGREVARVLGARRPLVLLFPESRRPEKEWAGFVALTDLLLGAGAMSLGEPLVCWLGSSLVADGGRWGAQRFANLTGRTSITDLPLLVGKAAVVVANDSGPMHLAAAMGRPVVALFGPTDPRRYGPYPLDNPRHRVLRAPSGLLADISPQQVAQTVADLLG